MYKGKLIHIYNSAELLSDVSYNAEHGGETLFSQSKLIHVCMCV
jgi:hypothetical protein